MNGFDAVILDVDGVLLDSPHEAAWRAALAAFADPARFTTALYQEVVAGKPRLDGARAALQALGADAARAKAYAAAKQQALEAMIARGEVAAFDDGLAFLRAAQAAGLRLAAASSSLNARRMMRLIAFDGATLDDAFDANTCGQVPAHGKPDPEIFLSASAALAVPPRRCVVVEDAAVGIAAAKAGGMGAIGVARHGDAILLAAADLVVERLDTIDAVALRRGRLTHVRG